MIRCDRRLQEGARVPRIEVEDAGTFDVEEGKRLVLAIEEDAGVDILHRCGSYARCTTCRIEYIEGEPEKMTKAEVEVLEKRNLLGEVLKIAVHHDDPATPSLREAGRYRRVLPEVPAQAQRADPRICSGQRSELRPGTVGTGVVDIDDIPVWNGVIQGGVQALMQSVDAAHAAVDRDHHSEFGSPHGHCDSEDARLRLRDGCLILSGLPIFPS